MGNAKLSDISVYQGAIDYDKLASMVDGVFIRAAIRGSQDARYKLNWAGMRGKKPRSPYHCPDGSPGQAEVFIRAIGDDPGEMPAMVDCEIKGLTELILRGWLDSVEKYTGKTPLIYSNYYFWKDTFGAAPWAKRYGLFIANYPYSDYGQVPSWRPFVPAPWDTWTFWQNSKKGKGADYGVASDDIDLDIFNGTKEEMYVRYGLTPMPTLEERLTALEERVTKLEAR